MLCPKCATENSDAARFCGECGSALSATVRCADCGTALTYRELAGSDTVDVTGATLDEPALFRPTREIWVRYRAAWLAPLPGVAQYLEDSDMRKEAP